MFVVSTSHNIYNMVKSEKQKMAKMKIVGGAQKYLTP